MSMRTLVHHKATKHPPRQSSKLCLPSKRAITTDSEHMINIGGIFNRCMQHGGDIKAELVGTYVCILDSTYPWYIINTLFLLFIATL